MRWGLAPLFVVLMAVGCDHAAPRVDLDTPEDAAASVGRILCAEHLQRVRAIGDELDVALSIQAAKSEVLADAAMVDDANTRLTELEELFDERAGDLESCEVVLTDIDRLESESKVLLSMRIETKTWSVSESGALIVVPHRELVLLTLTQIRDEWRVTASSVDFGPPGGALRSLLD